MRGSWRGGAPLSEEVAAAGSAAFGAASPADASGEHSSEAFEDKPCGGSFEAAEAGAWTQAGAAGAAESKIDKSDDVTVLLSPASPFDCDPTRWWPHAGMLNEKFDETGRRCRS